MQGKGINIDQGLVCKSFRNSQKNSGFVYCKAGFDAHSLGISSNKKTHHNKRRVIHREL
jgi:hypothetical protein